ncbi:MAG: radical SAM protein, partial [bacterium]
MKILLANSVGIDKEGYYIVHSPSRWSWGWKNYPEVFTYYPWELAYTSSLLKKETTHEVKFIDGCLEKLNRKEYLKRINVEKPDWLIMESSSRTINEDIELAKSVKEIYGTSLIFCGAHPTAYPQETLKIADYVCIGEYEHTVFDLISGKSPKDILGLYPNPRRPLLDFNSLPWPEDEDVSRLAYGIPGEPNCEYLEIQMYASRGCPFGCKFCVSRHLYFARPNWRPRKVENIIAEIRYLRNKYPQLEGIFFDEEVHNGNKQFVMELTTAIKKAGLHKLKYNAMCAYWNMDREMLEAFKSAGYYKLRIGIETGSEKIANSMGLGKKYNLEKLKEVLIIAREIGIKIYGTFTVGGLGSDQEEEKKTTELLYDLVSKGLLNDLQVSINTPQPGTPFYHEALGKGYLKNNIWSDFDGGNQAIVNYPYYSPKQIEESFQDVLKHYDLALEERCHANFRDNLAKNFEIFNKINKVLIFRSARMWHVNLIVEYLKKEFLNLKVGILGQEKIILELEKNRYIDNIYYYNHGFFNVDKFEQGLKTQLISECYDMVIIPHNNFKGVGYDEVENMAVMVNQSKILI